MWGRLLGYIGSMLHTSHIFDIHLGKVRDADDTEDRDTVLPISATQIRKSHSPLLTALL